MRSCIIPFRRTATTSIWNCTIRRQPRKDLGGWRFTGGSLSNSHKHDDRGRRVSRRGAGTEPNLLARYPNLAANPALVVGDFDGNLASDGERLALARRKLPSTPTIHRTSPRIYTSSTNSNTATAAAGPLVGRRRQQPRELIDARADNRLSPNWADSDESSKHRGPRSNTPVCWIMAVTRPTTFRDHARRRRVPGGRRGGHPQECRQSHQQLDLETGLTGWTAHGDHDAHPSPTSATTVPARSRCAPAPLETLGRTKFACPSQVHWRRDKRRQSAPKCGGCAVGRKFCFACVEVTSRRPIVCCCRRTSEHRGRSTAVRSPMPARRSLITHSPVVPAANQAIVVSARVSDIDSVFRLQQDTASTQAQNLTDVAMNDSASTATRLLAMGFSARLFGTARRRTILAFIVEAAGGGIAASPISVTLACEMTTARCAGASFISAVLSRRAASAHIAFGSRKQSITNWAQREVLSNERIPGRSFMEIIE